MYNREGIMQNQPSNVLKKDEDGRQLAALESAGRI